MTSYSLCVSSRGGFPLRPSSNGHVLMPVKMHRQGLTPLVYFTPTVSVFISIYIYFYLFYNYAFYMISICVEYGPAACLA